MDRLRIRGGRKLKGEIQVSGAKNSALPILFATLLSEKPSRIERVPDLHDIESTLLLLKELGADVRHGKDGVVDVSTSGVNRIEAPYDLVRKMRASVLTLGPLLARFGEAKVSLPGGCAIGARPIDLHLKGLEKLGAEIKLESGYVFARASQLKGARIVLDFPSVGATENLMMAATLADGETVIENAAMEPEIVDLAAALRSMGVAIKGEGSSVVTVLGAGRAKDLAGMSHRTVADRIEAGTYLAAGLITGGQVTVRDIDPSIMDSTLAKFEEMGAEVRRTDTSISLVSKGRPRAVEITTRPFPGFPTDMQAQFMAVAAVADGASVVTETIFENRFMHASELIRLGADIRVEGNRAVVHGQRTLTGAPVMATDLRASASLVLAGLAAEGETVVSRIYHLDRGYERIAEKFASLGAEVHREK
jgi:UDP-N-acetylglucosamine 1-carboxyvinyltransferase